MYADFQSHYWVFSYNLVGLLCVCLFSWFNCNLPFKKLWQNTCSGQFLSFLALQVILASFCVYEGSVKWFMIFSEAQRESDALYLSLPTWDAISAVLLLFLWLLLDVCWLLDQHNHLIFVFCMTQAIHHIFVAVQKSLFCIYFSSLKSKVLSDSQLEVEFFRVIPIIFQVHWTEVTTPVSVFLCLECNVNAELRLLNWLNESKTNRKLLPETVQDFGILFTVEIFSP